VLLLLPLLGMLLPLFELSLLPLPRLLLLLLRQMQMR
jgi:hypothetical protein